ncbi:MAG: TatD family hydrolase [Proteobacteria bacterium]|nr:TatD family hydrolase [Pseudomonadota bacterium]MBU4297868.1 TatD family hydrolase [Pseudomonadota bacterium]MCG2749862.1 TatD family hydrolase [Desulfobulbaceae bacterium]
MMQSEGIAENMHLGLTDTHAHLCDQAFDQDRQEVIQRAQEAGIAAIVMVGETLEDARRNLALAAEYPCLKPAAGLYPEFADMEEAEKLSGFIRRHGARFYAIGEVGLDFWLAKEEADREVQRLVFRKFIELASELDLPLNVHSRSAGRQAVALLLEQGAKRVQMHAFDGRYSAALPAVEAGFFFSVPPSLVRSRQKQKLVGLLPLCCLLVESDSPVLGPDPARRNEPANVVTAVKVIAEIKDIAVDAVLEAVRENTRRLYGDL